MCVKGPESLGFGALGALTCRPKEDVHPNRRVEKNLRVWEMGT